jgi:hypothetical protein
MAVKDAAAYLGISVDLLLELQGAELIRSTLDALDQRPKFRRQCLNSFLKRLGPKPTSAPTKNGDVSALVQAAIRVRCPTIDIIDLIMAGELTCILLDGATLSMAGIGVSVSELKRVLPPLHMPALSKGDTARRLRMTYQSINQSTLSSLLVILRPKDCATQNRDNFSTPSHWRAFSGLRRNSSRLGTWHVSIVARPVLSRHIWKGRVSAQRSVMGASVAIMRALPLLGDLKGLA